MSRLIRGRGSRLTAEGADPQVVPFNDKVISPVRCMPRPHPHSPAAPQPAQTTRAAALALPLPNIARPLPGRKLTDLAVSSGEFTFCPLFRR